MAITVTTVARQPDTHRQVYDITLDALYAAGGYAVTNAQWNTLVDPSAVYCEFGSANGLVANWDTTNKKIKIFKSAGSAAALTEVTSADITTAVVVRAIVFGAPTL